MTARRMVWALCLAFLAIGGPAGATEIVTGGASVTLPASRVIDDDCLVVGSDVQALALVKGDLMAAGATVSVSGAVRGDVQAAGGTLLLHGPIQESLRAVGGTVIVSGPIGDNVLLAGGTVSLDSSARVGRDAFVSGNVLRVGGPIGRDLRLAGSEATVTGEVGGDLRAEVGRLTLGSGALIHGDLVVVSPKAPTLLSGAKVLGKIQHRLPEQAAQPPSSPPANGFASWLAGGAMRFFTLLVLGGLALVLAPTGTGRLEATLRGQIGASLLTGLAALILTPIVAVLLMVTLVGIPAGIALLLVYVAALLHSGVTAASALGRWLRLRLHRSEGPAFVRLAWGALALALATSLPWIGGIVTFVAVLGGLGALVFDRGRPLLDRGGVTPTVPPGV